MSKKSGGGRYTPPKAKAAADGVPNLAAVAPAGPAFWSWYARMKRNPITIRRTAGG